MSFNYFVIAGFNSKQAQLKMNVLVSEQKIEQQLSNRKIAKLEKERLEAEIQEQEEEKRGETEREAEEAKKEVEQIAWNQVLAAQKIGVERQQAEELKQQLASQKLADERDKQGGMQLKIEKCKSEYNASKSKMATDLEKQLNTTKSLMTEIEKKAYDECVAKRVPWYMEAANIQPDEISGRTYADIVILVKNTCRSSAEVKEKIQLEFDNLKRSKYDKVEQKLQEKYKECLDK